MSAFLLSEVVTSAHTWPRASGDSSIRPLPGWNALEHGIFRGWKHHGEHWFGHNSIWPGASAISRAHPQLGVALVVASTYHPAPLIAGKLFADLLPEYRNASFPKPLPAEAIKALRLEEYCGNYSSAVETLAVELNGASQLTFSCAKGKAVLVPAADEIFFLRPPTRNGFSFVQFLQREDGRFRYLWDGSRVYPRRE